MNYEKRNKGIAYIGGLCSATLTLSSAYLLSFKSSLAWTVHQKEYLTALVEIVILFIATFLIIKSSKNSIKNALVLLTLEIAIFLFMHSFFWAAIIALLYIIEIILIGRSINKSILREMEENAFVHFTSGVCMQIVIVAVASLLEVGTPDNLRVIFLVIFFPVVWINRDLIGSQLSSNFRKLSSEDSNLFYICCISGAITLVLLQAGRASICLDYDSVWYGLRSEYMLAPFTGIFDRVISTECVYIYSKGFEIIALPFAGLKTFGYIYAINIWFSLLIILSAYFACRTILNKTLSALVGLCIAATPGIMNMAVTAKADIATTLFETISVYCLLKALVSKEKRWYFASLQSILLSYVFKSTSLYFSTPLLLIIGFLMLNKDVKLLEKNLFLPILAVIAVVPVFMRTYLITGVPVSMILPSIMRKIGLPFRYPFDFVSTSSPLPITELFDMHTLFERVLNFGCFIFAPISKSSGHFIIAWSGMAFFFSIIILIPSVIILLKKYKASYSHGDRRVELVYTLASIFILVGGISFGSMLLLQVPDGNYYALWYVATYMLTVYVVSNLNMQNLIMVIMIPALIYSGAVCLASNTSWTLGLTPVVFQNMGYYNNREILKKYFESNQLEKIYAVLSEKNKARVMMISDKYQFNLFIPSIIDSWHGTSIWGGSNLKSVKDYVEYLSFSKIEYLLVDRNYISNNLHAKEIICAMADSGYLSIDEIQGDYALLDFDKDHIKSDNELIRFLGFEPLNLPNNYRVVNNVCAEQDLHAVSPSTTADTPSGHGLFFTENEFVLISPFEDRIDLEEVKDASLYLSMHMPYDTSDGASVKISVSTGKEVTELDNIELDVTHNVEGYIVDLGDIYEDSNLMIEVYSPNGNQDADWVIFDECLLLQKQAK